MTPPKIILATRAGGNDRRPQAGGRGLVSEPML